MRYLIAVALAAALAVPAGAAPAPGLAYSLTFAGGTITGTVGGVAVQGTYTGTSSGSWLLTVGGAPFASGTYTCTTSLCTFTGTTIAGTSTTFTFTSASLTGNTAGSVVLSAFPNHGAWVSTVAHWVAAHLQGRQRGEVVSQAAGGAGRGRNR